MTLGRLRSPSPMYALAIFEAVPNARSVSRADCTRDGRPKWLGWWPKRDADLRKLAGNNLPPSVEVKVDGLAPHLLNYAVQKIEGFAQRILGPARQVRERPGV